MEPYRGVEPRCFAWKANVFPLDQYGAVGPAGIEPAYAGIRPAAKSVLARDPLSGPAESNRVSPESESGRLPSSSIPRCVAPTSDAARWRWRESNPLRRRLQGVSATSAVIPMAMRRPVQPVPGCSWALFRRLAKFRQAWRPADNGAHAMDVSISKHVHPWVVLRRDRRS